MNNYYLIGMPGCGKSSVGRSIADACASEFVDLDSYIETSEKMSIPKMFDIGEDYFRCAETRALECVGKMSGAIVATGGGIIVKDENIRLMKQSGTVIFIDAEPDFILQKSSLDGRPLLADKQRIFDLYKVRRTLYEKTADVTFENSGTFGDLCDNIIFYVKNGQK